MLDKSKVIHSSPVMIPEDFAPKFKIIKHEFIKNGEVVGTNPYFTIKKLIRLFGFSFGYRTITETDDIGSFNHTMIFPTIGSAIKYIKESNKEIRNYKSSGWKKSVVKEIY